MTDLQHGCLNTQTNTLTLNATHGYRIEKGRLTHPIHHFQIRTSFPDVLNQIEGVGQDFMLETARGLCTKQGQTIPVSVGQPTVLVRNLQIFPL